jgi:DNA processing protein
MINSVIYKDDKEYPKLLKQVGKEAPKQIYYKGEYNTSIFENCLAVIGSRRLTSYGKEAAEQLVSQIASPRPAGQAGITIVSGFMYGGDAAAHQAAIKVGGRTIAVMPCGIDLIHPEHQKELYQEILNNKGLIISEYKGEMKPALWSYPQRNRIVAGLSQAVLVLEAGEKSGTLITANYAKKFKRKIFALPGPITGSVSKGTNLLIKQGAEMVTGAKDILDYYRSMTRGRSLKNTSFAKDVFFKERPQGFELQVFELLEREPMTIDELSRHLGISSSELGVKLSLMEMQGVIRLRGGKYYTR